MAIEDYALIGDCETAALIGRDGSLDWLCWPRFDSGACFAALVGTSENGRWLIDTVEPARARGRRYLDGTMVLETTIETASGTVTLTDFMPPRGQASDVVRVVAGVSGTVRMRTDLVIRFDYGSLVPWVTRLGDGTLRAVGGPDMVVLRTSVHLHGKGLRTLAEFDVRAGESIPFVLTYGPSHLPPPDPIDWRKALDDTIAFWREWCGKLAPVGPHREAVRRSMLTLKALTYQPTGGIVAAPTTSLPEDPGGERNWDYRYCWLRDATFTLLTLLNSGFHAEARAWRDWLLRAVAGTPAQVQIMYGIGGERRLDEREASWLQGFGGAKPVRIGNAASSQLQLDVFGELMDALHQARVAGLEGEEPAWALQQALLAHLEAIWREPDQGLWESRGPARHFTHSKVMAWVAFDRAVKTCEMFNLEGPVTRWRHVRDEIRSEVLANGFDSALATFVQSYGSRELDSSLLLLPIVGFIEAGDPRMRATIEAIERSLTRDGLVMRYRTQHTDDGLGSGEGVFLACSFWLADNLILLGRLDDAERLFARLLAVANDLGLLAEEYDPSQGRMLGNFPQALSHIGLVNTAHNLARSQVTRKVAASGEKKA